MAKVLVALANGSEDIEVVTVIDILRRADIDVIVATVMPELKVTTSHGVQITADCHIQYCQNKPWQMVVLPGGLPGAQCLAGSDALKDIISDQIRHEHWVAAIGAAPALVLAARGFVAGTTATCYPTFRSLLEEHHWHHVNEPVVTYNNIITSQGPATAIAFALQLVTVLKGDVKAKALAAALCY